MHKLFQSLLFALSLFVVSCDDGDIITINLDFPDTFSVCGNAVFYKINTDVNETISVKLSNINLNDVISVDDTGTNTITVALNGDSNSFNYRTYNDTPENVFCNDLQPSGLQVLTDYNSPTGTATINTTLIEDDNDGIPATMEDINANGNLDDDDTDGDSLPNYLDSDDDGDNVITSDEFVNYDMNSDLSNAQDFDNDGIPNYLDKDDDGDAVLTRDEENFTQDQSPTNDVTNSTVGPDYLNPNINTTVTATAYREHVILQTYKVKLILKNVQILNTVYDVYDFGELKHDATTKSRIVTPTF